MRPMRGGEEAERVNDIIDRLWYLHRARIYDVTIFAGHRYYHALKSISPRDPYAMTLDDRFMGHPVVRVCREHYLRIEEDRCAYEYTD